MSGGYLARVAARAVGQAVVASPRLPALFEERDPGTTAGLEAIAVEVVVPAPRPQLPAPEPNEPALPTAPARVTPAVASASEPARAPAPEATPATVRKRDDPPPPGAASPLPDADRAPEAIQEPRRLPVAEATLARANLVEAPRVQPPTPAAPAEAPPVRVHIGRLEVRANLPEPAAQRRPRREEPRTPELSLSDYLRGRAAR